MQPWPQLSRHTATFERPGRAGESLSQSQTAMFSRVGTDRPCTSLRNRWFIAARASAMVASSSSQGYADELVRL